MMFAPRGVFITVMKRQLKSQCAWRQSKESPPAWCFKSCASCHDLQTLCRVFEQVRMTNKNPNVSSVLVESAGRQLVEEVGGGRQTVCPKCSHEYHISLTPPEEGSAHE